MMPSTDQPSLVRRKSTMYTRQQTSAHSTAAFVLQCAARLQFGPKSSVSIVHACGLEGTDLQYGVAVEIVVPNQDTGARELHALSDFELRTLKSRFQEICRGKHHINGQEAALDELLYEENPHRKLAPHCQAFVLATHQQSYQTWELRLPSRFSNEFGDESEASFVTLRHTAFPPFTPDTGLSDTQFDMSFIDETQIWLRPTIEPANVPCVVSERICGLVSHSTNAPQRGGGIPSTESIGTMAPRMMGTAAQRAVTAEEEERFSYRMIECAKAVQKSGAKIVLLTGPSACGKTSTANRLAMALRSLGYTPCILTLDEYYRDPHTEDYPKDDSGQPYHECVEALRIERFQDDLKRITNGETVQCASYDFKIQRIVDERGKIVSLGARPIVIAEGLFALSPKLTPTIPAEQKFNVFISPIALNIDEFHRPSCIDISLMRRVHRDFMSRDRAAAYTIHRAGEVARGSSDNILPFLVHANFFVNTCMSHELWIMQQMVAPLLRSVAPSHQYEWSVAQQLLHRFLSAPVDGCPADLLPECSVLQEFYGVEFAEGLANPPKKRTDTEDKRPKPISFAAATGNVQATSVALGDLVPQLPAHKIFGSDSPIVALNVNGVLRSLRETISPFTGEIYAGPVYRHSHFGVSVIKETIKFMCFVAAKELYPQRTLIFEHGFFTDGTDAASGFCCSWMSEMDRDPTNAVTDKLRTAEAEAITHRMQEYIAEKVPITLLRTTTGDAMGIMQQQDMPFSVELLRNFQQPEVMLAKLNKFRCVLLGPTPLAADCSVVGSFAFYPLPYDEGYRLAYARPRDPSAGENVLVEQAPEHLNNESSVQHRLLRQAVRGAHSIACAGDINAVLGESAANATHVANLCETMHTNECFTIAERIVQNGLRLVSVAGASTSGKTTFVRNLKRALRSHGHKSLTMSLDDYYMDVTDSNYPKTPDGRLDHESVYAMKMDELSEHLSQILDGKAVDTPVFEMGKGMRSTTKTRKVHLPPNAVIILEGLFALSPLISPPGVRDTERLKILLHPMPLLQLDELHYVSTELLRVLRRVRRDNRERGRDAAEVLHRAPVVIRGEVSNTLAFINAADVIVCAPNVMETNDLAVDCETLLRHVSMHQHGMDIFTDATRLRSYLKWFQPVLNTPSHVVDPQ